MNIQSYRLPNNVASKTSIVTEKRDSQIESTKSITIDINKFKHKSVGQINIGMSSRHMTPTNQRENPDAMVNLAMSNIKE